uniref:Putative zn2+ transporter n=1 Tax=Ixodes ricinus TaxID=34613 RepID=A0A0K8REN9_IXORI
MPSLYTASFLENDCCPFQLWKGGGAVRVYEWTVPRCDCPDGVQRSSHQALRPSSSGDRTPFGMSLKLTLYTHVCGVFRLQTAFCTIKGKRLGFDKIPVVDKEDT